MRTVAKKVFAALCGAPDKSGDREFLRKTGLSDDDIEIGLQELADLGLVDLSHDLGGGVAVELTAKGRLRCMDGKV